MTLADELKKQQNQQSASQQLKTSLQKVEKPTAFSLDQLGEYWDSATNFFDNIWHTVTDKDEEHGIKDYSKYKQYKDSLDAADGNSIKLEPIYQQMEQEGVIDSSKFKQWYRNKPQEKYKDFDNAVENIKKTADDKLKNALAPYMSGLEGSYQLNAVTKAREEMNDQIAMFIDSYAETFRSTRDEDLLEKFDEDLDKYVNSVVSFTEDWARNLTTNNVGGMKAYYQTLEDDQMKEYAKGIRTLQERMENKLAESAILSNFKDAGDSLKNGNLIGAITEMVGAGMNTANRALDKLGDGVEYAKNATLGWYDAVEELNHLNVYSEDAGYLEKTFGSIGSWGAEIIDGAPTLVPMIAQFLLTKKLGGVAADGEDIIPLVKNIFKYKNNIPSGTIVENVNNLTSIGKIPAVWLSEGIQNILLWDIAFQQFENRPLSDDDLVTNFMFNLPSDIATALLAKAPKFYAKEAVDKLMKGDIVSGAVSTDIYKMLKKQYDKLTKYHPGSEEYNKILEDTSKKLLFASEEEARRTAKGVTKKTVDVSQMDDTFKGFVSDAQKGVQGLYERVSEFKGNVDDYIALMQSKLPTKPNEKLEVIAENNFNNYRNKVDTIKGFDTKTRVKTNLINLVNHADNSEASRQVINNVISQTNIPQVVKDTLLGIIDKDEQRYIAALKESSTLTAGELDEAMDKVMVNLYKSHPEFLEDGMVIGGRFAKKTTETGTKFIDIKSQQEYDTFDSIIPLLNVKDIEVSGWKGEDLLEDVKSILNNSLDQQEFDITDLATERLGFDDFMGKGWKFDEGIGKNIKDIYSKLGIQIRKNPDGSIRVFGNRDDLMNIRDKLQKLPSRDFTEKKITEEELELLKLLHIKEYAQIKEANDSIGKQGMKTGEVTKAKEQIEKDGAGETFINQGKKKRSKKNKKNGREYNNQHTIKATDEELEDAATSPECQEEIDKEYNKRKDGKQSTVETNNNIGRSLTKDTVKNTEPVKLGKSLKELFYKTTGNNEEVAEIISDKISRIINSFQKDETITSVYSSIFAMLTSAPKLVGAISEDPTILDYLSAAAIVKNKDAMTSVIQMIRKIDYATSAEFKKEVGAITDFFKDMEAYDVDSTMPGVKTVIEAELSKLNKIFSAGEVQAYKRATRNIKRQLKEGAVYTKADMNESLIKAIAKSQMDYIGVQDDRMFNAIVKQMQSAVERMDDDITFVYNPKKPFAFNHESKSIQIGYYNTDTILTSLKADTVFENALYHEYNHYLGNYKVGDDVATKIQNKLKDVDNVDIKAEQKLEDAWFKGMSKYYEYANNLKKRLETIMANARKGTDESDKFILKLNHMSLEKGVNDDYLRGIIARNSRENLLKRLLDLYSSSESSKLDQFINARNFVQEGEGNLEEIITELETLAKMGELNLVGLGKYVDTSLLSEAIYTLQQSSIMVDRYRLMALKNTKLTRSELEGVLLRSGELADMVIHRTATQTLATQIFKIADGNPETIQKIKYLIGFNSLPSEGGKLKKGKRDKDVWDTMRQRMLSKLGSLSDEQIKEAGLEVKQVKAFEELLRTGDNNDAKLVASLLNTYQAIDYDSTVVSTVVREGGYSYETDIFYNKVSGTQLGTQLQEDNVSYVINRHSAYETHLNPEGKLVNSKVKQEEVYESPLTNNIKQVAASAMNELEALGLKKAVPIINSISTMGHDLGQFGVEAMGVVAETIGDLKKSIAMGKLIVGDKTIALAKELGEDIEIVVINRIIENVLKAAEKYNAETVGLINDALKTAREQAVGYEIGGSATKYNTNHFLNMFNSLLSTYRLKKAKGDFTVIKDKEARKLTKEEWLEVKHSIDKKISPENSIDRQFSPERGIIKINIAESISTFPGDSEKLRDLKKNHNIIELPGTGNKNIIQLDLADYDSYAAYWDLVHHVDEDGVAQRIVYTEFEEVENQEEAIQEILKQTSPEKISEFNRLLAKAYLDPNDEAKREQVGYAFKNIIGSDRTHYIFDKSDGFKWTEKDVNVKTKLTAAQEENNARILERVRREYTGDTVEDITKDAAPIYDELRRLNKERDDLIAKKERIIVDDVNDDIATKNAKRAERTKIQRDISKIDGSIEDANNRLYYLGKDYGIDPENALDKANGVKTVNDLDEEGFHRVDTSEDGVTIISNDTSLTQDVGNSLNNFFKPYEEKYMIKFDPEGKYAIEEESTQTSKELTVNLGVYYNAVKKNKSESLNKIINRYAKEINNDDDVYKTARYTIGGRLKSFSNGSFVDGSNLRTASIYGPGALFGKVGGEHKSIQMIHIRVGNEAILVAADSLKKEGLPIDGGRATWKTTRGTDKNRIYNALASILHEKGQVYISYLDEAGDMASTATKTKTEDFLNSWIGEQIFKDLGGMDYRETLGTDKAENVFKQYGVEQTSDKIDYKNIFELNMARGVQDVHMKLEGIYAKIDSDIQVRIKQDENVLSMIKQQKRNLKHEKYSKEERELKEKELKEHEAIIMKYLSRDRKSKKYLESRMKDMGYKTTQDWETFYERVGKMTLDLEPHAYNKDGTIYSGEGAKYVKVVHEYADGTVKTTYERANARGFDSETQKAVEWKRQNMVVKYDENMNVISETPITNTYKVVGIKPKLNIYDATDEVYNESQRIAESEIQQDYLGSGVPVYTGYSNKWIAPERMGDINKEMFYETYDDGFIERALGVNDSSGKTVSVNKEDMECLIQLEGPDGELVEVAMRPDTSWILGDDGKWNQMQVYNLYFNQDATDIGMAMRGKGEVNAFLKNGEIANNSVKVNLETPVVEESGNPLIRMDKELKEFDDDVKKMGNDYQRIQRDTRAAFLLTKSRNTTPISRLASSVGPIKDNGSMKKQWNSIKEGAKEAFKKADIPEEKVEEFVGDTGIDYSVFSISTLDKMYKNKYISDEEKDLIGEELSKKLSGKENYFNTKLDEYYTKKIEKIEKQERDIYKAKDKDAAHRKWEADKEKLIREIGDEYKLNAEDAYEKFESLGELIVSDKATNAEKHAQKIIFDKMVEESKKVIDDNLKKVQKEANEFWNKKESLYELLPASYNIKSLKGSDRIYEGDKAIGKISNKGGKIVVEINTPELLDESSLLRILPDDSSIIIDGTPNTVKEWKDVLDNYSSGEVSEWLRQAKERAEYLKQDVNSFSFKRDPRGNPIVPSIGVTSKPGLNIVSPDIFYDGDEVLRYQYKIPIYHPSDSSGEWRIVSGYWGKNNNTWYPGKYIDNDLKKRIIDSVQSTMDKEIEGRLNKFKAGGVRKIKKNNVGLDYLQPQEQKVLTSMDKTVDENITKVPTINDTLAMTNLNIIGNIPLFKQLVGASNDFRRKTINILPKQVADFDKIVNETADAEIDNAFKALRQACSLVKSGDRKDILGALHTAFGDNKTPLQTSLMNIVKTFEDEGWHMENIFDKFTNVSQMDRMLQSTYGSYNNALLAMNPTLKSQNEARQFIKSEAIKAGIDVKRAENFAKDFVGDPLMTGPAAGFLSNVRSLTRFLKYSVLSPVSGTLMYLQSVAMSEPLFKAKKRGLGMYYSNDAFQKLIGEAGVTDWLMRDEDLIYQGMNGVEQNGIFVDRQLKKLSNLIPGDSKAKKALDTAIMGGEHSIYDMQRNGSVRVLAFAEALQKNGVRTPESLQDLLKQVQSGTIKDKALWRNIMADTEMQFTRFFTNANTSAMSRHRWSRAFGLNFLQGYVIHRTDEAISGVRNLYDFVKLNGYKVSWKDVIEHIQNDNPELRALLNNVILTYKMGYYLDKTDKDDDNAMEYFVAANDYISSLDATFFMRILTAPYRGVDNYLQYSEFAKENPTFRGGVSSAGYQLVSDICSQIFREGKLLNATMQPIVAFMKTGDLDFASTVGGVELEKMMNGLGRFGLVDGLEKYGLADYSSSSDIVGQVLLSTNKTSVTGKIQDKMWAISNADKVINDPTYAAITAFGYLPVLGELLKAGTDKGGFGFTEAKYKEMMNLIEHDKDLQDLYKGSLNTEIFTDEALGRIWNDFTAFNYPQKTEVKPGIHSVGSYIDGKDTTLNAMKENVFVQNICEKMKISIEQFHELIQGGSAKKTGYLKTLAAAEAAEPGAGHIVLSYMMANALYEKEKQATGKDYPTTADVGNDLLTELKREVLEEYGDLMFTADKASWYKTVREAISIKSPEVFKTLYKNEQLNNYLGSIGFMDMLMWNAADQGDVDAKYIKNAFGVLTKYMKNSTARTTAVEYLCNQVNKLDMPESTRKMFMEGILAANIDFYDNLKNSTVLRSVYGDVLKNFENRVWGVLDEKVPDFNERGYSGYGNRKKRTNYGDNNEKVDSELQNKANKYFPRSQGSYTPSTSIPSGYNRPNGYTSSKIPLDWKWNYYEELIKSASDNLVKREKILQDPFLSREENIRIKAKKLEFPKHKRQQYSTKTRSDMPGSSG